MIETEFSGGKDQQWPGSRNGSALATRFSAFLWILWHISPGRHLSGRSQPGSQRFLQAWRSSTNLKSYFVTTVACRSTSCAIAISSFRKSWPSPPINFIHNLIFITSNWLHWIRYIWNDAFPETIEVDLHLLQSILKSFKRYEILELIVPIYNFTMEWVPSKSLPCGAHRYITVLRQCWFIQQPMGLTHSLLLPELHGATMSMALWNIECDGDL